MPRRLVLDVFNVSDNSTDALVKAREAQQEAIFDLGSGKEIPVQEGLKQPSPEELAAAETRVRAEQEKGVPQAGNTGEQPGLRGAGDKGNEGGGNPAAQPSSGQAAPNSALDELKRGAEQRASTTKAV